MENRGPLVRRLTLLLSALASGLLVFVGLLRTVESLPADEFTIPLDVVRDTSTVLQSLRRRPILSRQWRVAFMGDSTAIAYPQGRTLPDRLGEVLSGVTPPARIYGVAVSGMAAWEYYFLSELVVGARPDQVVLTLNLASLSDRWLEHFARGELAGWIPPQRLGEAMALPLPAIGVTFDRLLFYVGLVRIGAYELWRAFRERQALLDQHMKEVRTRFAANSLDAMAGPPGQVKNSFAPGSSGKRFGVERARARYGPALAGVARDHPVIEMLHAAVRTFARAEIPVLVYVIPTNIEHLARLGILDEGGLAETIETIRDAVEEPGGVLVDLHALFPDEGFRDAPGHFTVEEPLDGPFLVAKELAPYIGAGNEL